MPKRQENIVVPMKGGLITNMPLIEQGNVAPGSANRMLNFEPYYQGGYRRIEGYNKLNSATVTGTGDIQGVFDFNGSTLAVRNGDIYESTTSDTTWTKRNSDTRSGSDKHRFHRYIINGDEKVVITSVNNAPVTWDGSTYSVLTNAPTGQEFASEFQQHLFLAKDDLITFSAPLNDNDYTVASGSGQFRVASNCTGMIKFRERLIVFCEKHIYQITGQNATNFARLPITEDIGCEYPDTIWEFNGDIYYLAPDGIRTVAGTERNDDTELGSISRSAQREIRQLIENFDNISAVVIRGKTQYRLMGYNGAADKLANNGVLLSYVYDIGQGNIRPEMSTIKGFKARVASSSIDFSLNNDTEVVLFAGSDGYVYQMESGNDFDGDPIPFYYRSPFISMNDPMARKLPKRCKIFLNTDNDFKFRLGFLYDYPDEEGADHVSQTPGSRYYTQYKRLNEYIDEYSTLDFEQDASDRYGGVGDTYGVAIYGRRGIGAPIAEAPMIGSGFVFSIEISGGETDVVAPFTLQSFSIDYKMGGRR